MPRFTLLAKLLLVVAARPLAAQTLPDTTRTIRLPEATVTGYGQQLPLRRTAASIGLVDARVINRFNQASLTAAVNTLPGVRLEERATASYRLSIRGSTLRSPFGVRNVKVYYHDIPFTEASGSTPLNLLDPATIARIEVLKGPAGSAYGAGTGGAVRFETPRPTGPGSRVQAGFTLGSFGLRRSTLSAETSTGTSYIRAQYARQTLDGYRQNSALRREVLTLNAETAASARHTLAVHVLYADIAYQLPGGLTAAQFEQNPRQARPDAGPNPGTVTQQASYASRTGLAGITSEYQLSGKLTATTTLYGTAATIQTPFLVDFERNANLGGGGRSVWRYATPLAGRRLRLAAGAEYQGSFETSRNYQNQRGTPGALRYDDEVATATGFFFAQADVELPFGLLATAGASYNRLRYRVNRVSGLAALGGAYALERNFRPEVSPRLALLKEITPTVSAYASFSTGFSPPTEEEIRPSSGLISPDLRAERGRSYEAGLRGSLARQRLTFDLAVFDQRLNQTIVTRSTDAGITLFSNAGTTRQRGLEAALSGWLWQPGAGQLQQEDASKRVSSASPAGQGLRAWLSYAYNGFRFEDYQSGGQDFSGNRLTGSAPHTLSAGLDFTAPFGFYLSPTANHQSAIPLNDANTVEAAAYWTLAARAGWRTGHTAAGIPRQRGPELDLFVGVENATDRRFSLGNDLNAFGNRYFQPAPGRNFYGGASLGWRW
ncbi:TonB-dependent receptor [Hymenobacter saemangeumensis]|uniref:TonB-dependent receptor n=1 Tax=Hymenobacter saemangeumensis TaxID=1084522 RepID=A0ABP8IF34_9BACT